MYIRKGDTVVVTAGDSRYHGKHGRVLTVFPKQDRVLVEGVNFVWKHLRRSQEHRHGARIKKEAPLHFSNIRIVCQACTKPTKVVSKRLEDGGRVRLCTKCKQSVSPEE